MAFFEDRFPPRISFGARGGPSWSTSIVKSPNGRRSANRNRLQAIHRYDVAQGVKNEQDMEEVRAFFYNVFGQFDGFRYKDWADYKATRTNTSLVNTGGSNYQLYRRYTFGARTFDRKIQKPVSGSVVIYDAGGSPLTATVDYTTGIAAVTGTPASWVGEFDVPVCFLTDLMEVEVINKNGDGFLQSWTSIPLEEIVL